MFNRSQSNAKKRATAQPFNGLMAMQEHLDICQQVEGFVSGGLRVVPRVVTNCEGECTVARWLHSESGACCKDVRLVDSLCQSCTQFREAASHIVWLASSGYLEKAREALHSEREYAEFAEEFQHSLVSFNLHHSGCPD